MNLKDLAMWTIYVSFIIIFLVASAYLWKFADGTFSDSKAEWGAFGDYIGGILNPLAAIANLIFLAYVSYQLSELDKSRGKAEQATQKKIALYSLKNDAYKELANMLSKVQGLVLPVNNDSADSAILLRQEFIDYFIIQRHLFDGFVGFDGEALLESWTQLIEITSEIIEVRNSWDDIGSSDKHNLLIAQLVVQLNIFNQERSTVLQFVFRASIQ
ncbi:hypothetical protein [Dyadobacter sp. LHD-138]|uniref:hypothetical protein n=1 Tax=Dyadobacter sp. LHD-138 TaxID=3071413 RepID=UPI0027DFAE0E|nr:hypothetical protein [Dyadobacter sp. LHD-138]MDQ6482331.1 hypothetical protein [Dyadobacter sp. LHD-138]